jgi:hypothetical protein
MAANPVDLITVDQLRNLTDPPGEFYELHHGHTSTEFLEKQEVCLANGCFEFWIVDPKRQRIHVTAPGKPMANYGPGQQIPVALLDPDASISVDAVFA